MDPLWHPAVTVPVVSTVTMGMVVSTAVWSIGLMIGLPSTAVPRGQQHLRVMSQQMALHAEELNYSDSELERGGTTLAQTKLLVILVPRAGGWWGCFQLHSSS